jgi:hypothetical protein
MGEKGRQSKEAVMMALSRHVYAEKNANKRP